MQLNKILVFNVIARSYIIGKDEGLRQDKEKIEMENLNL